MADARLSVGTLLAYVGPGFLISVAYMDPGNWATNVAGGALRDRPAVGGRALVRAG